MLLDFGFKQERLDFSAHSAASVDRIGSFLRRFIMGMEDRDWYREKKIDWERGGLRERNSNKRRFRKYIWWVVAAIVFIVIVVLSRQM